MAVAVIVLFHLGFVLEPGGDLLPGAAVAVDIFFVLSGFLITHLLLEERRANGRVSLGAFWTRRALRLLPALAAFLATFLSYAVLSGSLAPARAGQWVGAVGFYVANVAWVITGDMPEPLAQTWSLAIEEQFYLLWPPIFAALSYSRRPARALSVAAALGIIVCAGTRIGLYRSGAEVAAYALPIARGDSLLMGCLVGVWHRDDRVTRWLAPRAWLGAAVVAVVLVGFDWREPAIFYIGFPAVAAGTAVVILAVVGGSSRVTRFFEFTPLVALGRVSYGVYLWHVFALYVVREHTGLGPTLTALAGLLLTAAVTAASWVMLERPFLSLKNRVGRAGSGVAPRGRLAAG